jgi:hypothetical protein
MSIRDLVHASVRSTRFGPMIATAAAITVLGELPASRAASAAARAASPTRLISAATSAIPSRRQSSAMLISPRKPSRTMRIFSSAE